ncbi:tetratricopeptide repeat protein [Carboxylicivirga sp. A043]|uniref:tetratricopeptide repeat protein n=1 Tax=Carboxylicivirga litoralis TaxID=2816963 RepID=UPI0021CB1EAB|nr:tetratricopeptide repeat protein [Carboxylicivirga sp. A043]MCU4154562.1 tetratricopeptide repeat protein [Carboxylicivirga sp. A043]
MHFCTKQKYDDALDLLRLNLENYKAPYETYYFLGQVFSMKGNKDKAIKSYERSYAIKEIWDVKDKIKQIKNE